MKYTQKFTEAVSDTTAIDNVCSFKCHNCAYAKPALLGVIKEMEKRTSGRKK